MTSIVSRVRDEQRRLEQVAELFVSLAGEVADFDLHRPTACDEWDVGGVLNAVAVKAGIFTEALSRPMPDKPDPWPDLLTDDPVVATDAVEEALSALVRGYETADADALLSLPLGPAPVPVARKAATLDVFLHAWDLADAIGAEFEPDPGLPSYCLGVAEMLISDDLRARGEFGSARPDDGGGSDLDRLIALTGRMSVRS